MRYGRIRYDKKGTEILELTPWSNSEMLHVIRAECTRDYRVHLWFNDGTDGEIDLRTSLNGPIFEQLKDLDYFKSLRLEGHTIVWPNGADFAPEYLQELI